MYKKFQVPLHVSTMEICLRLINDLTVHSSWISVLFFLLAGNFGIKYQLGNAIEFIRKTLHVWIVWCFWYVWQVWQVSLSQLFSFHFFLRPHLGSRLRSGWVRLNLVELVTNQRDRFWSVSHSAVNCRRLGLDNHFLLILCSVFPFFMVINSQRRRGSQLKLLSRQIREGKHWKAALCLLGAVSGVVSVLGHFESHVKSSGK